VRSQRIFLQLLKADLNHRRDPEAEYSKVYAHLEFLGSVSAPGSAIMFFASKTASMAHCLRLKHSLGERWEPGDWITGGSARARAYEGPVDARIPAVVVAFFGMDFSCPSRRE
jgi:hypothetical protein